MKKELIISFILIALVVVDLWLWVPFESDIKVDWFLLVESYLRPHWYIRFTTHDLLVIFLSVSLCIISTDIRLKRVAKAIAAYFAFKCIAMWCFDDQLAMSPYLIAFFTYCFVTITFGNRFIGLTEIMKEYFGTLKQYVKNCIIG